MAADLQVNIDTGDLRKLNKRMSVLLQDALHLEEVYAQAAEYMKRATVNRIVRSKTGPDGERWEALREVTIKLREDHGSSILFESGELSRSIQVDDVSHDGFVLGANAKYAATMQNGYGPTTGMIKGKQIPPRPFMGFSDENKRRISKMIRDYLAHGGD